MVYASCAFGFFVPLMVFRPLKGRHRAHVAPLITTPPGPRRGGVFAFPARSSSDWQAHQDRICEEQDANEGDCGGYAEENESFPNPIMGVGATPMVFFVWGHRAISFGPRLT